MVPCTKFCAALATGWCLVGCGAAEPPAGAVAWDLVSLLDVAERSRLAALPTGRPVTTPAGAEAFLQAPGSVVSWYFPIPASARLRGYATLRAGDVARELVVSVEDETGESRTLVRQEIDPDETLTIDSDLGDLAGRLARIRCTVRAAGTRPPAKERIEWKELRIEGSEPPSSAAAREGMRGPYNVLLVLFDTLRADRLSPYAETRVATPNIARLAAGGALFENAYANATYTTPSVASMLTSVHPSLHRASGLPTLGGNPMLPDGLPVLPELLQDRGYATLFVVNNLMVSPAFGFGRGFDRVVKSRDRDRMLSMTLPDDATPEGEADAVWGDHIEPFLAEAGDRPFFLYLHEIDPHSPYAPPEPWNQLYTDSGYRGWIDGFRKPAGLVLLAADPGQADGADRRYLNGLYDGEVAFVDAYLGHLLRRFEQANLERSTLVVLVSDHGESIGDNDRFGHGNSFGEEVLRVPLLLSLPGVVPEGLRVAGRVELLDLAPTILDLVGARAPETMRGRSLVPLLGARDSSAPDRPTIATGHFPGSFSSHVVHFRDWKLVRRNAGPEEGLEHDEFRLYDLASDPGETRDVWEEAPIPAGALRQMLATRIREDAATSPWKGDEIHADPVPPESLEQLRALGYVE